MACFKLMTVLLLFTTLVGLEKGAVAQHTGIFDYAIGTSIDPIPVEGNLNRLGCSVYVNYLFSLKPINYRGRVSPGSVSKDIQRSYITIKINGTLWLDVYVIIFIHIHAYMHAWL